MPTYCSLSEAYGGGIYPSGANPKLKPTPAEPYNPGPDGMEFKKGVPFDFICALCSAPWLMGSDWCRRCGSKSKRSRTKNNVTIEQKEEMNPKDKIKEHAKAIENIMSCNMYSNEFKAECQSCLKENNWFQSLVRQQIRNPRPAYWTENPPTNQPSVPYSRTSFPTYSSSLPMQNGQAIERFGNGGDSTTCDQILTIILALLIGIFIILIITLICKLLQ